MTGFYVAIEGGPDRARPPWPPGSQSLDMAAVFDPFAENPFLAELLTSQAPDEALALRVELTFLALRVAQLRKIGGLLAGGTNVVADWALFKQPIFAETTLAPADAARVAATVDIWTGSLPAPHVLIALSASETVLRQRVTRRGRAMEAAVTGAELAALNTAFERAYALWPGPMVRGDACTFDVFDDQHLSQLATQVRQLVFTNLESR